MPKKLLPWYLCSIILFCSCGQQPNHHQNANPSQSTGSNIALVGEGCDGCDLMYVGMPQRFLSVDSSPAWHEKGERMLLQGTVYEKNGSTPAPGIIIYYHHTNNDGLYAPSPGQDERSKRHGHIRGWVQTDQNGHYKIYTIKPGPYPGRILAAHVHFTIKEPGINEYYIDDVNFDDDPLLTKEMIAHREQRGGSGLVTLKKDLSGLWVGTRDIILGKNVPNYK